MNKLDKISYLSFYILRYSNSVFTETKYMELPKIFFGYFVFLGYLVTMATAFLSYPGSTLKTFHKHSIWNVFHGRNKYKIKS